MLSPELHGKHDITTQDYSSIEQFYSSHFREYIQKYISCIIHMIIDQIKDMEWNRTNNPVATAGITLLVLYRPCQVCAYNLTLAYQ